jgi:cell division transport system permease protein
MTASVLGFLAGEALRDLVRAGWITISSVLLITLSLLTIGGFWVFSTNLGEAVARWREQLRVIVYLKEEPPPASVGALMERIRSEGGVARIEFVSKAEALRRLKRELGAQAAVAGMLPNPLPASLEVTPHASASTPEATGALIQRLASMPEVSEVQGGTEWVERLAQFQRLLQLIGLGIGGVLVLAAVLTVTTATTLVLYARRDELDIMRLVGVPEAVIRLPLLLQGIGQGLLGAILALLGLIVGYRLVRPGVEPLVNLTLGLPHMTFLSATAIVTLLGSGALLGAVGGWLAKGRS